MVYGSFRRKLPSPAEFSPCSGMHDSQNVVAGEECLPTSAVMRTEGRVIICQLDELRPHPSYCRHNLAVPASKFSALAALGDVAFREPIVITTEHLIIDGYARWELASRQHREALACVAYDLTESESLHWMLLRHRRSNGFNDFIRIELALELEPWLVEKARANQRAGGQKKGLSNLTKAESVNVRSEIARAAGASAGNVTKVKNLVRDTHPEVLRALRSGEVRIHRAWLWSKHKKEKQADELNRYRQERGVKRMIRGLISKHVSRSDRLLVNLPDLISTLAAIQDGGIYSVNIAVIRAPGKAVFITEELLQALGQQRELEFECREKNR